MANSCLLPVMSSSSKQTKITKRKIIHQWKCDFCQVATFNEYDDACRHEEECALNYNRKPQKQQVLLGQQEQKQQKPQTLVANEKKSNKNTKSKTPHEFFAPRAKSLLQLPIQNKNNVVSTKSTASSKDTTPSKTRKRKSKAKDKKDGVAQMKDVDSVTTGRRSTRIATQKSASKKTNSVPQMTSSKAPRKRMKKESLNPPADKIIDVDKKVKVKSNKKTKLAGIFVKESKALLAEQRHVEFLAKRRLERQREQKRNQERMTRCVEKETRKVVDDIKLTLSKSESRGFQKHVSDTSSVGSKTLPPLAPRFPLPSHVIPQTENQINSIPATCMTTESNVARGKWFQKHIKVTQSQHYDEEKGQTAPLHIFDSSGSCQEHGAPPHIEVNEFSFPVPDLISDILHDIFAPTQAVTNQNAQLWVEKYGSKNCGSSSFDILGSNNQESAQRMRSWVYEWCKTRDKAMERMADRQRKLQGKRRARRKKNSSSYEEDNDIWFDSDDDEFGLCNVCLVTGPPGSGKSSLVHAVAAESKCQVLEINTTEARGGMALKNAIQEATQSCSSLDLFQKRSKLRNSFFENTPNDDLVDSEDEDDLQQPTHSSLTVVLIDEVDVMDETNGDAGFWPALATVSKTAKCPIFLTANATPRFLLQSSSIRYNHFVTSRPDVSECVSKVWQVAKMEQFQTRKELDSKRIKDGLAQFARQCRCDVRRILHELQLFSHSKGQNKKISLNSPKMELPGTEKETPTTQLCRPTLAMTPKIISIKPKRVPSDSFSVLTIKGENFLSLAYITARKKNADAGIDFINSLDVHVAGQVCPKVRLVDNETIVALCPPCAFPIAQMESSSRNKRQYLHTMHMAHVSIKPKTTKLGMMGTIDRSVETTNLSDGSTICSSRQPYIEYCVPLDCKSKRHSRGTIHHDDAKKDLIRVQEQIRDGMCLWRQTMSQDPAYNVANMEDWKSSNVTTESDQKIYESLETLCKDTQLASDAAFIEEMQPGIPYLAGACRGFGFDLTDDGAQHVEGKLRKHEHNARPPSEDRLFSLGWKDNCYFFGDNDTFVTLPTESRERRLLHRTMTKSRGMTFPCDEIGASPVTDKEVDCDEDATNVFILSEGVISEENMFLPKAVPSSLLSLPSVLRRADSRHDKNGSSQRWHGIQHSEQRRRECANKFGGWLLPILQDSIRLKRCCLANGMSTNISMPMAIEQIIDSELSLDYLPTLRRMAILERAAEYDFNNNECCNSDNIQKSTRRSTRRTRVRRHFFDFISTALRLDTTKSNSSQVGSQLADSLLRFDNIREC